MLTKHRDAPNSRRHLRESATDAERRLWQALRNRALDGHKFRRQHAIGEFVADFCCPHARLIIEVDGALHGSQVEADAARTAALAELGYRVLRLTNREVLQSPSSVLERIRDALIAPEAATCR